MGEATRQKQERSIWDKQASVYDGRVKPSGHLLSATDCYAEPVPFPVRLRLGVQKLLNLIGVIPFMWYYRKEDLYRLLEQCSFVVVDTDSLYPAPVNYLVHARK